MSEEIKRNYATEISDGLFKIQRITVDYILEVNKNVSSKIYTVPLGSWRNIDDTYDISNYYY